MDKFIVIAVLIVSLCQCQVIDPVAGITSLKNDVETVSNDLEISMNNFMSGMNVILKNFSSAEDGLINEILTSSYNDTYITIAADNNQNAHHCLRLMKDELSKAGRKALGKLEQCIEYETSSLWTKQITFIAHIEEGKRLLSQLEDISVSCSSDNQAQEQLCVDRKMLVAGASVNNYKATTERFKNSSISLESTSLSFSMSLCFQHPMGDLHSDISAAKISAAKCSQNR